MTVSTSGGTNSYLAVVCGPLKSAAMGIGAVTYTTTIGSGTDVLGSYQGNPLDGTSPSCFAEHGSGVVGTGAAGCVGAPFPDSPRWEIQLPVETSGSKKVSVQLKGDGTNGPTCTTYVFDVTLGLQGSPGTVTNTTTSFVPKDMTVFVSVGGTQYMTLVCTGLSGAGTDVGMINYTP
ncbi:MAG TPA: hypothetical protein VN962_19355 [Polyangia bacterium]|nr:hypothetical protein [Polyangia bacterium]